MPMSDDDEGQPSTPSGEPQGFAPAAIVERAVLDTTRRGERLITAVRLATALGFIASWPLTAWLQPAVAPRQRALAGVAAVSAGLSLVSLRWLRRRPPSARFLSLAVGHDVALASGLLLVGLLWRGPWYAGSLSAPGTPSLCIVMVLAGLRLSRRLSALGIGLGWLVTAALVGLDLLLYGGRYRPAPDIVMGVMLNLIAASLTAWATTTRSRTLIDEAAGLASMAARAAQRLGAYLPPTIAEAALVRADPVRGVERREVAILFTRLPPPSGEKADATAILAERNASFDRVVRCVREAGGVIDSFRHDGAMAVFGATAASEDSPARRAVAAAEAMRAATRAAGRGPSADFIGVHFGTVALGDLGTRDRLTYTAIGDVVNVAARIASLAVSLETPILVSESTRRACDREPGIVDPPVFETRGELPLRGRREPVRLCVPRPRASPSAPDSRSEGPASWDHRPTSPLLAQRWERGAHPQVDAARIAEAPIARAATDADALVARVRLGVGLVAILAAPYLTGAYSPKGVLAYRVLGGLAVLSAVAVLVLLRRRERPRWWLDVPIVLDTLLASAAIYTVTHWDRGHYRGTPYIVAFGLMYVIILLAGIRLRARTVLLAGSLSALFTAGLLVLEAQDGTAVQLHNALTLMILIAASTAIGFAGARRAVGLARAVARQARDAIRARSQLGAYASEAVAEELLRSDGLELGGRNLERVAVLASDLRGFTRTAEDLDPADLVAQLNAYFEAMAAPIREQGGVIDSFVGDAILVVFGAPEPTSTPSLRAMRTALGMRRALLAHNAERAEAGLPPLRHGIGIDVGPVVAGHLGTETRAIYTVVGDPMVRAETIEAATKGTEATILASDAALTAAREETPESAWPRVAATFEDAATGLRLHAIDDAG